ILDEMASYRDSPEESIMDDFEDLIFHGHGLGHNILGIEDDLNQLSKPDLLTFINQNYNTHEMIIGISGNYTLRKLQQLVDKIWGALPENSNAKKRMAPDELAIEKVTRQ